MSLAKNALKETENLVGGDKPNVSDDLLQMALKESAAVLMAMDSQADGLSPAEAEARVKRDGLNEIAREKRQSPMMRPWDNVRNLPVILQSGLGVVSYLSRDLLYDFSQTTIPTD